MRRAHRFGQALCLLLLSFAFAGVAKAHDTTDEEDEKPSIFEYGWQGLSAGALVGLGGGYLVGRQDGWRKSDWRAVGLGAGIGALAGAGLGLSLGLIDRGGAHAGYYIARDLSTGSGFGLVIGAIAGGISAAVQHEPEHVLYGAAIGVIGGAGLGLLTGIIEGATRRDRTTTARKRAPQVAPSLAWTRTVDGSSAWLPGVSGRF